MRPSTLGLSPCHSVTRQGHDALALYRLVGNWHLDSVIPLTNAIQTTFSLRRAPLERRRCSDLPCQRSCSITATAPSACGSSGAALIAAQSSPSTCTHFAHDCFRFVLRAHRLTIRRRTIACLPLARRLSLVKLHAIGVRCERSIKQQEIDFGLDHATSPATTLCSSRDAGGHVPASHAWTHHTASHA